MSSKALQKLEKICLVILIPPSSKEDCLKKVRRDIRYFFSSIKILYVLSYEKLDYEELQTSFWFETHTEALDTSDFTSILERLVRIAEKDKDTTIFIDVPCLSAPSSFIISTFAALYRAKPFFFKGDEITYFPVAKRSLNPLDKEILVVLKSGPVKSTEDVAKLVQKASSTINYRLRILAEWGLIEITPINLRRRTIALTFIGGAFAKAFSQLVLVKDS